MKKWLVCSFLIVSTAAFAQAPDTSKVEIKVHRLASSVAELEGMGGNIGVSFGDDGVFVIDDQFASLSAKIHAAIATLSKKPIRFVLNTHWHGDHTGGNELLGGEGAIIVAHDNVRQRLSTEQFSALKKQAVPAAPPKALPIITFSDQVTFHLNGDEVHVFHVAPAHTDGDSIIHFKKANVIHMGDTFTTAGYPFVDTSSGGAIDGFIAAADKVLAIADDSTKIIPGHGPLADKKQLKAWRDMLATIRDRVARLKAQKETVEEVKAQKPTAEYDAVWAKSFIKPDVLVELVYNSIR